LATVLDFEEDEDESTIIDEEGGKVEDESIIIHLEGRKVDDKSIVELRREGGAQIPLRDHHKRGSSSSM